MPARSGEGTGPARPPPGSADHVKKAGAVARNSSTRRPPSPALAWGWGAGEVVLKSLLTIGSLQLLTMLVHLVCTKSLAGNLGPKWIGVMAVVDRLLGIVE